MSPPQHGTRARYEGSKFREPCRCERCKEGYRVYQKMFMRGEHTPRDTKLHDDKVDTILEILAGP